MKDDTTNFFNILVNTKGTNAKMDYVKQNMVNKTVVKLLEMTFNPYISFNVVKPSEGLYSSSVVSVSIPPL